KTVEGPCDRQRTRDCRSRFRAAGRLGRARHRSRRARGAPRRRAPLRRRVHRLSRVARAVSFGALWKILGTWQKPPDVPSLVIAILGAIVVVASLHEKSTSAVLERILPPRWQLALGAALLSLGYIAWYLRGGPRIIDATT